MAESKSDSTVQEKTTSVLKSSPKTTNAPSPKKSSTKQVSTRRVSTRQASTKNWARNVAAKRKAQQIPDIHIPLASMGQDAKRSFSPREVKLSAAELSRREKDKQPVKGIFHFKEVPGGELKFFHRIHRGTRIEKYSLKDGETYTIPLGVAKHLNQNGWYPVHKNSLDDNGKPLQIIGKKIYRFGFQSLDFMDIGQTEESRIITLS